MKDTNERQHSHGSVAVQTTYEATVIHRAVARAGANPQLKGHIHEVLATDLCNAKDLLNGTSTALTKSTTARAVDAVSTTGGKVIGRLQYKDAVSSTGVRDVVAKVTQGQYRSVRLVGTDETTQLVNHALEKAGVAKRMTSSGISSDTTTSLAHRAGASGAGTLLNATQSAAYRGGAVGGLVAAGIEAGRGAYDLYHGNRTVGEVAASVGKEGAKGVVVGAVSSAAATAVGPAATTAAASVLGGTAAGALAVAAAPVAIAVGVGYGVAKAWDWLTS